MLPACRGNAADRAEIIFDNNGGGGGGGEASAKYYYAPRFSLEAKNKPR